MLGSRGRLYGAVAGLGLLVFAVVYGPGHAFGLGPYWDMPAIDERQALIGYRYFLHDAWHWPLFANAALDVPYVKSVAFLDCIPIWALVNKTVATIVPPWGDLSARAYLGLWHALAYALQPCLAVACVRALGHRSTRSALVTAAMFLAAPAWIARYGHPALSAHWILLWAIWIYLRVRPGAPLPRARGVELCAQLAVGALVTPYMPALSLCVLVPALARTRHLRSITIWLAAALATVVLACWLAGYFDPSVATAQWGFDWNSANLLTWLVPKWITSVDATPYQYEGYAYLGAGFLGLLGLALARPGDLLGALARHRYLLALLFCCCLLAVSNRVFAGGHELLHYRLPWILRRFAQQFRSPGRFVWIPMYLVMLYALHRALVRLTTPRAFAILCALAALQLADARTDWVAQRALVAGAGSRLDLAAWRPLVDTHREVVILPPYGCVTDPDPGPLDDASADIALLASEEGIPINGTYSARASRRCAAERAAWPAVPIPGVLYVLLPEASSVADHLAAAGAHCVAFAYGRACTTSSVSAGRASL